jgi:hypothetical protein
VWGRRENCQTFTLFDEVVEEMGLIKSDERAVKESTYKLGMNLELTRTLFEEAGFKKLRMWYQGQNYMFKDAHEYWRFIAKLTKHAAILQKFPQTLQ